MRLKLEPEGAPGPLSTLSENFFAGIEVRSEFLSLIDFERNKSKSDFNNLLLIV